MTSRDRSLERQLRRQTRVEVFLFACLNTEDACIPGHVVELSLTGARFECAQRLPIGRRCELLIQLDNRHHEALPVSCQAHVVRHLADGMGISIDRIRDPDGHDMLANLVLLHAPDPARAARELASLPRPKPKRNPSDQHPRSRSSAPYRL